ncbi:RNA polymerase sigma factor [Roseisolibacter agri]|uniref:DNA-directed RNA polymerase sigma-70 factor n=1 Tax=Roseisolibacter agri TaxID=2014610 RepID=A0AA37VET0_9BACT|nr:RNA polymerase sigma factor [Roseisolibacter agri]GLC25724.1 DNA-directed RNA polymerase sigma-70 factor [Roseisolibacter agri]
MSPTHPTPAAPLPITDGASLRALREAEERRRDAELVTRAVDGDAAAFEALVARHRPWCVRIATRLLECRDEAEDVVQVSLTRAHRALHQCVHREQFAPWLRRILLRRCYSVHERRTRRERWVRRMEPDDHEVGADREAHRVELRLDVVRAMATLPPAYRDAVVMRLLAGLDYHEMTAATGLGHSAMKMRVQRGCARLRRALPHLRHDAA